MPLVKPWHTLITGRKITHKYRDGKIRDGEKAKFVAKYVAISKNE